MIPLSRPDPGPTLDETLAALLADAMPRAKPGPLEPGVPEGEP